MKKMRKGFTLVELLLVVAILAVLTSTMMVSMQGATAKAKAASIAANLDSCRAAAVMYYAKHGDEKEISGTSTTDMLKDSLKTWVKMKGDAEKDNIYYIAGTTSATNAPDKWAVKVDFSNDPEKDAIATALSKMKGYSDITAFAGGGVFDLLGATPAYADATGKLFMTLITGEITDGESGFTEETETSGDTEDDKKDDDKKDE